jgi:hypothetical protein
MKHSCWIVCAVAVLIVVFAGLELLAQATDPLIETWELNVAKSKFNPGPPPKSSIWKYEAVGNGWKYTGKTVNADGTTSSVEWTAYFDGKDYPYSGSPNTDTISLKRIDRFTSEGTFKKAGKVTGHGKRAVSQDGKVLTFTNEGTDAQGKPSSSVQVFDKK